MEEDELLKLLILMIEQRGYKVKSVDLDGGIANISNKYKICAYDPKVVTAYSLAHEFIHAKNNDSVRLCENDVMNPAEQRANKEAILLLWELFVQQGGTFDYFMLFVEIIDAPFELTYALISKEYADEIEQLNALDSREVIKRLDEQEMKEYAVDYISHFDAVEEIEIYRFLDLYQLAHNLYDLALKIFSELLGIEPVY